MAPGITLVTLPGVEKLGLHAVGLLRSVSAALRQISATRYCEREQRGGDTKVTKSKRATEKHDVITNLFEAMCQMTCRNII